ncbi:hypothetical protein KKE78_03595 [Patescibacteria group bacterium]|nr:hypothetical protein [Patescibacteria group bacterium]
MAYTKKQPIDYKKITLFFIPALIIIYLTYAIFWYQKQNTFFFSKDFQFPPQAKQELNTQLQLMLTPDP